jgi:predicted DNA-binding antitoxin AbrB/MazE fold protein
MKRSSGGQRIRDRKRSNPPDQEYRVGPGRPPKEYQFKPGQSGNPKGAPRKPESIAPELGAILERSLNGKVTLRQGEKEKIVIKFAAGIEQLVTQFAKGDRDARRDLFLLVERLGVLERLRKANKKKAQALQVRRITSDMSLEEASAIYAESVRLIDRPEDDDPET